jgi:hypothetical protein
MMKNLRTNAKESSLLQNSFVTKTEAEVPWLGYGEGSTAQVASFNVIESKELALLKMLLLGTRRALLCALLQQ